MDGKGFRGGGLRVGSEGSGQIHALTGLRALAAWMVWLRHTELYDSQPEWLTRVTHEFHLGVTLFFVLSGFLITLRYYETSRLDWSWFRDYVKARVARIYPVYFAVTIPSLVIYQLGPLHWFLNFTFLGGFTYPSYLAVAPAWSLTVEECFYFSAPLLFVGMKRGVAYGFWLPLALAYLVVALLAMDGLPNLDRCWFAMNLTYAGRILEFLVGTQAALLVLRGRARGAGGWLTWGGIAVLVASIAFLVLRQDPGSPAYRSSNGFVVNNLFGLWVLPWGAVLLIVGLSTERTWLGRVLSLRVIAECGRGSYVFYLIHMGFVAGALAKLGVQGVLQFLVLNVISVAAYRFYEQPLQTLLRAKRAPKRAPSNRRLQTA